MENKSYRAAALVKQVIIKAAGLDRIILQLKNLLTNAWAKESRDAIIDTLRLIESSPGLTRYQMQAIQKNLSMQLGQDFAALVNKKAIALNESAYILGAKEAARHAGVRFAFGAADRQSVAALNTSLRYWIGEHFDAQVKDGISTALTDFFTLPDASRRTLADALAGTLGQELQKSEAYWNFLADHTATKTREIGRVSGYEAAEIKRVQIVAQIDERTTTICRRLNGRIVEVPTLRKAVDKHLEACESGDPEKMKSTWKWYDNKTADGLSDSAITRKLRSGQIFLPPYHGGCRTITVAYFGD